MTAAASTNSSVVETQNLTAAVDNAVPASTTQTVQAADQNASAVAQSLPTQNAPASTQGAPASTQSALTHAGNANTVAPSATLAASTNNSANSSSGNSSSLASNFSYDGVKYVPRISPYAQLDLKIMSTPAYKNEFLIGKPVYNENNITYEETPQILKSVVNTSLTDVVTASHPVTQQKLWGGINQPRGGLYKDVRYGNEPEEEVHHQLVPVKFNQHPQAPQADILDQVPNPVVRRLFESSQTEKTVINPVNHLSKSLSDPSFSKISQDIFDELQREN